LLLSSKQEIRLPLRFIAILRNQVDASLALTTGVHRHEDILKGLMVGADVTMVCSAVLRHGSPKVASSVAGLEERMVEHE